ncbi:uncharacterized protein L969DRAFT_20835 [Mixia osmundae IAM 14324]|uniref:Uncharacterized protein n=1 Tax=Mixia osmundae (strain CBS 9802 / IAM 14324 / JCM 22182 / KY 12970) TaxID=764103 RepID=G7E781_MIXOS|nr:uncharacterized protein L969DRAFT_20835 [Mixia osmundae IAM 14324]KEI41916.1 hypothetical protein L969DRAFT_20835 [Mixia osmundae IAM 14324]GAA98691.1 hypothetical protein E5Q_05379 [Mixia osmundae IAM 14324]
MSGIARRRSSAYALLTALLLSSASFHDILDCGVSSVGARPASERPVFVPEPGPSPAEAKDYLENLGVDTSSAAKSHEDLSLDISNTTKHMYSLAALPCLPSTANDVTINALFAAGGPGYTVSLCPNTVYTITSYIIFTAHGQELSTQGYPTGSSRALINVMGSGQATAIYGACGDCNFIKMRNIQINGNRPLLGRLTENGWGLMEIGGPTNGQVVDNVHAYEPRGWTAMHITEGYGNSCTNATVSNGQFGPSGTAPNTARQFYASLKKLHQFFLTPPRQLAKRDYSAPGEWADGISISCASTTIINNVITNPTDGGIVLFGCPNSYVAGNTVIAEDRTLLGGINMVDFYPWNGNFSGLIVEKNNIVSAGSMIKVGIAMGTLVWGSINSTQFQNSGGTVRYNTLSSSGQYGYIGFGIATAGHLNAATYGNTFSAAAWNGIPSQACVGQFLPPRPKALTYDPYTTSGSFQTGSSQDTLMFLICMMPYQYDPSYVPPSTTSTSTSSTSTLSSSSSIVLAAVTTKSALPSTTTTVTVRIATSTKKAAIPKATKKKKVKNPMGKASKVIAMREALSRFKIFSVAGEDTEFDLEEWDVPFAARTGTPMFVDHVSRGFDKRDMLSDFL